VEGEGDVTARDALEFLASRRRTVLMGGAAVILHGLNRMTRTVAAGYPEWRLYFPGEKYRKTFPDLSGSDQKCPKEIEVLGVFMPKVSFAELFGAFFSMLFGLCYAERKRLSHMIALASLSESARKIALDRFRLLLKCCGTLNSSLRDCPSGAKTGSTKLGLTTPNGAASC
jgi:hypothetical protein